MPARTPRVTVGMAVYKGEPHVAEAIRSVQAQDFVDWELLLVNDASPDNSVEIIEAFDDPRIRLVHNPENEGLVAVRNRILEEARGEFIAWLDQDDLAAPTRLSSQVAFLAANPHISVCGSVTRTFIQGGGKSDAVATSLLPLRHRDIRAAMPFLNPMACNTVTMRAADFTNSGLTFRLAFGNSLDYDMWSVASDHLFMANLPQPLGAYRVHAGQTSQGAALDLMKDHALRVQSELIERALGITLSEETRRLHNSATITPLRINDHAHLEAVTAWFAQLQDANRSMRAFDDRAFSRALVRQLITVAFASRVNLPAWHLAIATATGATRIHPGVISLIAGAQQSCRRRMSRRSSPLRQP